MEEDINYFFDSYAIIEIMKNNANYLPYAEKPCYLSLFNLVEIYYSFLNDYGEEKANKIYETYKDAVVEISEEVLKKAMRFRRDNKKKDLSYADCIGYIYSKENKMRFLTGDKEFSGMENVEFVK